MTLRPELYNRLMQAFGGDVVIRHEGEAMDYEVVPDYDEGGRLRMVISHWGETYAVDCPYCDDLDNRLHINYRWNLEEPGVGMNLWLCQCLNKNCLKEDSKRLKLRKQVFEETRSSCGPYDPARDKVKKGVKIVSEGRPIRLPGVMWPINDPTTVRREARLYLKTLGYDLHYLFKTFHVCYCSRAREDCFLADKRIVAPVYQCGRLAGWQALRVDYPSGRPPSEHPAIVGPKYYTCPGMKKTHILYNLDRALQSACPFVVVCEKVADVWSFGPEAVALFGTTLSERQRRLLVDGWGRGAQRFDFQGRTSLAVVLLDGDAHGEARRAARALEGGFDRVIPVFLPETTDPGDYPTDGLRKIVDDAVQQYGYSLKGVDWRRFQ
jgi:hypothetical protein